MIILGIDPGFDRLGCAVLEKKQGKEELVFSDCFVSQRGDPIEKRICFMVEKVEKIIKKLKPDVLAIEKVFFAANQKTATAVAQVSGAIIYLAGKNSIPAREFSPLEVKMAVVGYGKAEKQQVQKMVQAILGVKKPFKYDDEMDAVAISLACSSKLSTAGLKGLDK